VVGCERRGTWSVSAVYPIRPPLDTPTAGPHALPISQSVVVRAGLVV
jgi:hypothetical protein